MKAAREPGEKLRDFHSLNYLSYNYLQLGRYKDAKKTVDRFAGQYEAIPNRKTAPDSQDLQARHVRGRTIFALPDRALYGYFDTLARYIVESESWSEVPTLAARRAVERFRRDEAASRGDGRGQAEGPRHRKGPGGRDDGASTCAGTASLRPADSDDASARGGGSGRTSGWRCGGGGAARWRPRSRSKTPIDSLSQPPYPIIPADELYGSMLMEMGRFAEARKHFEEALRRTPGRPKAIAGIALAAEAMGDVATAKAAAHATAGDVDERRSRSPGATGGAAVAGGTIGILRPHLQFSVTSCQFKRAPPSVELIIGN